MKPTVQLRSNPFVVVCGSQRFGSSTATVCLVVVCAVRACLLAQQDMSTKRYVFLFNKKTRRLGQQEDMSSCSTGRHVFLFDKRTRLLVEREYMSLVGQDS